MAQNRYRIEDIGPAGQGMVAECRIPRGTVILEEKPLLVFDTEVSTRAWRQGTMFFLNEQNCGSDIIHPKIQRSRQKATIRALHHLKTQNQREKDISIIELNAWGFDKDNNHWLSIFDHMSRVNHACVPNARVTEVCLHTRGLGSMKLIAAKDIAPNEEITVEYVRDGVWLQPRSVRREVLQNWGFLCTCPACRNKNAILKETELADLNALQREILSPLPRQLSYTDNLSNKVWRAEYYAGWLKEYGYGDSRLTEAYLRLAELYLRVDRYAEARQVIFYGLEIESHEYETTDWTVKLQKVLSQCGGMS